MKSPTRKEHLLDLVMSDLADSMHCQVLSPIADHNLVLTVLSIQYAGASKQSRTVFDNKSARWREFRHYLADTDWTNLISFSPDEAACYLKDVLEIGIVRFIPQRVISVQASSQSWLNQRCIALVRDKDLAFGTSQYKEVSQRCSTGLVQEYHAFIDRTRKKLQNLQRGSKRW